MVGFIVVAAVGFVLLLVSFIFDGILDALNIDATGSGIFSGASLGGLLTGLGCGGIIGTARGWSTGGSVGLGVVIGLAMAGIAIVLFRALRKAEISQDEMSLDRLVGTAGVVTAGAAPGQRGLVQLTYLGSPRTFGFSATRSVTTGESVVVTDVLGPDTVTVVPHQAMLTGDLGHALAQPSPADPFAALSPDGAAAPSGATPPTPPTPHPPLEGKPPC